MPLPYLTRDVPGIGGSIKQRPEDFVVHELPLYEPAGEGEHVYCHVQKTGLTTFDAVNRLSKLLNVPSRNIGYAGLKDARAVTRQTFSVQGSTPEAAMDIRRPELTVLWAARHGNKLRLGHLAGNRFGIKIRDVEPSRVVALQPMVERLAKQGVPNYFGEQRFGRRQNNHVVGAALVRGDDAEVMRLLLGDPQPIDDPASRAARQAYERNDLKAAMKLFPRRCGMERRLLARVIKTGKPGAGVRTVDEKLRRLWVSALQSELFNEIIASRIDGLGQLMDGDLALKHDNGAVFRVESAAAEQPRADAFEISPSAPLVGYRVTMPEGKPLEIEEGVFARHGLKPADFRVEGRHKVKGARRAMRIQPKDVDLSGGVDEHGSYIAVAFTLPAGSFATIFLRELMKSDSSSDDEEARPPVDGEQGE